MRRPFLLFFITLGIDQAAKYMLRTYPQMQGTFLRFTENDGIAFSIPLSGIPLWIVLSSAGTLLAVMVLYAIVKRQRTNLLALALITGGGLGNSIDRIRFGAVSDIFLLPGGLFFNIADVAICIGLAFLLCPVTKHHWSHSGVTKPR